MRFGLSVSVNEDLSIVAVGSHQDSSVVYLFLGQAGFFLDNLKELENMLARSWQTSAFSKAYIIGDAISEFCDLNYSLLFSPLRFNGVD
jgi:hypothetical protein